MKTKTIKVNELIPNQQESWQVILVENLALSQMMYGPIDNNKSFDQMAFTELGNLLVHLYMSGRLSFTAKGHVYLDKKLLPYKGQWFRTYFAKHGTNKAIKATLKFLKAKDSIAS